MVHSPHTVQYQFWDTDDYRLATAIQEKLLGFNGLRINFNFPILIITTVSSPLLLLFHLDAAISITYSPAGSITHHRRSVTQVEEVRCQGRKEGRIEGNNPLKILLYSNSSVEMKVPLKEKPAKEKYSPCFK